jgi:prenyltransferase beta subunit
MPNIDRRKFLAGTAALGLSAGVLPSLARGQQDALDAETSAVEMITAETETAIKRGLAFLASRQNDDGSFGSGNYGRNVAVCSLAGMAFMSGGSTPGRGPYGRNVDRCVDYVLSNAQESGFLVASESASHGPMYGHGFATLFLAEAYGMSARKDVREKLAKAVKLIVDSQNSEGGWRYQPNTQEADITVTICQIMALRAARNAGIYVPTETVDQCIDYVKRSQTSDGGFAYMLELRESAFPRSAAGLVALYSAGIYEGDEIDKAIAYLEQHAPRTDAISRESHFFYGHYYAVQAMWQAGGEHWQRWYPAIRDALLARQQDEGSWMDNSINQEYGTAMATIILQMPNNYLPIFQR